MLQPKYSVFLAAILLFTGCAMLRLSPDREPANLVENAAFSIEPSESWRITQNGKSRFSTVDAEVSDYRSALHIDLDVEPDATPWSVMLHQRLQAPLRKGDPLEVRFWARSASGARLTAFVEKAAPPWSKAPESTIKLTSEWQEYVLEGRCVTDMAPGDSEVGFHLAHDSGTIQLTGIRVYNHATAAGEPPPSAPAPVDLLSDPGFGNGSGAWNGLDSAGIRNWEATADDGVRLKVEAAPERQAWDTYISQPCQAAVTTGDTVVFSAEMKSPDNCRVTLVHERAFPPFLKTVNRTVQLTSDWKKYRFSGTARRPFPAVESRAKFFLGHDSGTVFIRNITVQNLGAQNRQTVRELDAWAGRPHPDHWREPALDRIEKIRKGPMRIKVVDSSGSPLPHLPVNIEMLRHHFRFGSAVSAERLVDKSNPDNLRYQQEVLRLYNTVTLESDLKWKQKSDARLAHAEKAIEWLRRHGKDVRGHCLLWGSPQYLGSSTADLYGSELKEACRSHVTDYTARFRGQLYAWDVVNEARTNTYLWDEIGWDSFAEAFRWAQASDPGALLCYNDFAVLNDTWYGEDRAREGVKSKIELLLQKDAPLDLIGLQAHMNVPLTPIHRVLEILDEMALYGKPLEITEFDLGCSDDQVHGEYFRDFLIAAFSHPAVESFIMWGFWEGRHWRAGEDAAMFRLDWSKKPAQLAYEDLVLKKWRTNERLTSDKNGEINLRAFYGTYKLTVAAADVDKAASVTAEFAPGDPHPVVIQVP